MPLWIASDDGLGRLSRLRPRGSLGLSVAGLFVAFGLSGFIALLWSLIGHPGGALVILVVSEIGLWVGLFSTCWLISARFGSRSIRRDFNLTLRWFDIGIAVIASLVGRLLANLIYSSLLHPQSSGNSREVLRVFLHGALAWSVLITVVCVGAPIFEELFFRGLLQGEMVERFGPWVGVPLTAIVFGSAHVFNAPGFAGIAYALSVMAGGIILGIVYATTRRLGASIATHAFFNALAFTALLSITFT